MTPMPDDFCRRPAHPGWHSLAVKVAGSAALPMPDLAERDTSVNKRKHD